MCSTRKKRKKRELQTKNNASGSGIDVEEDDFEFQIPCNALEEDMVEQDEHVNAKATKAHNAKVPEHL